jgi:hypothetical protein
MAYNNSNPTYNASFDLITFIKFNNITFINFGSFLIQTLLFPLTDSKFYRLQLQNVLNSILKIMRFD